MRKRQIPADEMLALFLMAAFILTPLFMAPSSLSRSTGHFLSGSHLTDWLTILVLIGQLTVFWRQLGISEVQAELMRGQLKATEKAAEAALASLERPWLVIEDISDNEMRWFERKDKLFVKFRITNYGKAPAFVKQLTVFHFRGPDHHNGRPPFALPDDVLDFPSAADMGRFMYTHGRQPSIEVSPPIKPGLSEGYAGYSEEQHLGRLENTNFVLDGGKSSAELYAIGYRKLEEMMGPGIHLLGVTDSYLLGQVIYNLPNQPTEILRFCFVKDRMSGFRLFKDFAPYNDRKIIKPDIPD